MDLTELRTGQKARIKGFSENPDLITRLAAYGFMPGIGIEVMQNCMGYPIIVSVRGSKVSLGKEEAKHIIVET